MRYGVIAGYAIVLFFAAVAGSAFAPRSPLNRSFARADSLLTIVQTDTVRHGPPHGIDAIREFGVYLGRFAPSFYQTVNELAATGSDSADTAESPDTTVVDRDGAVIADVSLAFFKRLKMEGAGRLRDGRRVTFVKTIDGIPRFRLTNTRFGVSRRGKPLVPYRTVAVDRRVVPLGSVLYIPAAVGIRLPDGTKHDGIFHADDTGGAIRGHRLDFYVGVENHIRNSFSRSGKIFHGRQVKVYRLPRGLADGIRAQLRVARGG